MSKLSNIQLGDDIKDGGDFLGGGRTLESGLYDLTIVHAYISTAESGAMALNIACKTGDSNQLLKQTFWITNSTAKGGVPYFTDKKTMEKKYLPGFVLADNLCLLTVGKHINGLDTEVKVINLYSSKDQKEVPTQVDMVIDLLGKTITAGVIKQTVNKTKKNDSTGAYEPTGETRQENEIDKFFRTRDGMTVTEIKAKATEPKFKMAWAEKWEGQVRDKSGGAAVGGAANGAPQRSAAASAKAQAEADALFA